MHIASSRRHFLTVAALGAPMALATRHLEAAPTPPIEMLYPMQPAELVEEMVVVAHSDIARVTELVTRQPALAKACWDWGFGDWETALGAASHVGRRDISDVLLAHGAHPTIFSAAMRGDLDVVKAFLAASPAVARTRGPHSISLLAHAKAGGPAAAAVVAYLQTIEGSDSSPAAALSDADVASIVGTYTFGRTPADRFEVSTARGQVQIQRPGRFGRGLVHLGALSFHPVGAEGVRVVFIVSSSKTTLEIHDPDVVLSAVRAQ